MFCVLLFLPGAFAQVKTDTIYVSDQATAFLVFPEEPNICVIDLKSQYTATIDSKSVLMKARDKNTAPSKFTIKVGDVYYQGIVMYKESPAVTFHDYRNIEVVATTTTTVKATVNPKKPDALDTARMQVKGDLNSFKVSAVDKYKTVGTLDNSVYFALSDLRHNSKASFVKLKLSNQSAVAYQIDHITFEIYENKVVSRNEIQILIEDCPRQVASKEVGYMYFALPLLSLPEACELKITLREKNGLRTITLFVPNQVITKSATF